MKALKKDKPQPSEPTDAEKVEAANELHIAAASVAGMDILLTWNCRHMANPHTLPLTRDIVTRAARKGRTSNIEVLKGNAGDVPLPSDKTSMDVDILLNGVCDVNGVPLLKRRSKSSGF